MNKQEAINKVKNLSREKNGISRDKGNIDGVGFKDEVNAWDVICILEQLEEPQQVVVPKFVAEWIEHCKQSNRDLDNAMRCTRVNNAETGVEEWIYVNQETFASAWLYGYQVEKEKLYTVEIPNPNNRFSVVFLIKEKGKVRIGAGTFFGNTPDDKWKKDPNTHLTESEIKQDFEWAWRWAEPVEVE
ncbi:DUF1642 domain-containing protein [Streptococcus suis]|uniref:DUF1642 domain-containing protein n=1 Tax=Streptococcus suis TaxID=1307 RepID=UPI0038B8962E